MHLQSVQRLFESFSHSELRGVHDKLHHDVQRKNDEIKELVSQRYRELLEASDTNSLNALHQKCLEAIKALQGSLVNESVHDETTKSQKLDTDRLLEIVENRKFLTLLSGNQLIPVMKQYFVDVELVKTLPDEDMRSVLESCLDRRRKLILNKCWVTIHRLSNIESSKTSLGVIAALTKCSKSELVSKYQKMCVVDISLEAENDLLLNNILKRVLVALKFGSKLFLDIESDIETKQLPIESNNFSDLDNNQYQKVTTEWLASLQDVLTTRIDTFLSKVTSIDASFALLTNFEDYWRPSIESEWKQVDVSEKLPLKEHLLEVLQKHIEVKISDKLSLILEPFKLQDQKLKSMSNSDIWNFVDNDNDLKSKSGMFVNDEVMKKFHLETKSLLDDSVNVLKSSSPSQNFFKTSISEQMKNVLKVYDNNSDHLGVYYRCQGFVADESLKNLSLNLWPQINDSINELKNKKCLLVIEPAIDGLGSTFRKELLAAYFFRDIVLTTESDEAAANDDVTRVASPTTEPKPTASWLPKTPSPVIHGFLSNVSNLVTSKFGHSFPVETLPTIWSKIREIVVTSYSDKFDKLSEQTKSTAVVETFAGQAYFDLLFVKQLMLATKCEPVKKDAYSSFKPIVKRIEALIDPFDLHLALNDFRSNVMSSVRGVALIFAPIVPNAGQLKGTSKLTAKAEVSLASSFKSRCSEFILIQ